MLLRKAGHNLHTTAEKEVVRTIKEKACYIAANPAKEEKELAGRTEDYRLPDGTTVQVRCGVSALCFNFNRFAQLGSERFRAPELLFDPEIIGQEHAGVPQVVLDSVNRVDMDLRKNLLSNVVLSGGSTLCRGV